jgi:hypothetical protein
MTHETLRLRIAAGALFASAVLPATPGLAQDVPTATPPPPVVTAPPVATTPPPVVATPPVTAAPQPQPRPPVQLAPRPPVAEAPASPPPAEEARPARQRTTQRAERPAPRPRAEAPAPRAAAPTPEPVSEPAPAPSAAVPPEAAAPAPLPPAATPEPVPVEPAVPMETSAAPIWPWFAAGAALLLALFAFFASRRRRSEEDVYEETVYAAPTYETPAHEPPVAAAPAVAAVPVAVAEPARVEETEISAANDSDVEALNATSAPVADRPWLEFLMRPVRAGTDGDEARVEFELTVGNTGSVPARDVRISTWMVASNAATEMERALIEPPADAQRTEVDIPPGDGAKVEAAISVPTEGLRGKVLPVIVADARYRLPDGSEGRTSASFAVGLPNGEGLEPFAVDLPSGLHDDVEARLHSEPQRV